MSECKKIVLVGGGHTHALFLKQWAEDPVGDTQLHVFDPQAKVPYTGMLPGFVAGHYDIEDLYIDLRSLTQAAGGVFHEVAVRSIDTKNSTLSTATGTFQYDILSIDVGIHTQLNEDEATVGVKPLNEFAQSWQSFIKQNEDTQPKIAVVGGGVAGVEVALAMAHRLKNLNNNQPKITIIDSGRLLNAVQDKTRKVLLQSLQKYRIEIRENVAVETITSHSVSLDSGEKIDTDFTLLATGPQPYQWLSEIDLPVTKGYVDVDETLRSPANQQVFAVGDCAHFLARPLPKAGVFAVRQAPILYRNICTLVSGATLEKYHPQSDYLKLISLGEKSAMADKWGFTVSGKWLWRIKNYIDRTFMKQFK